MNEVNCTSIFTTIIMKAVQCAPLIAPYDYDNALRLWRARFGLPLQSAEGKVKGQERHQG